MGQVEFKPIKKGLEVKATCVHVIHRNKEIPGLEVVVHEGTLRLFAADEQVFLFENINSSFAVNPEADFEIDIQKEA